MLLFIVVDKYSSEGAMSSTSSTVEQLDIKSARFQIDVTLADHEGINIAVYRLDFRVFQAHNCHRYRFTFHTQKREVLEWQISVSVDLEYCRNCYEPDIKVARR